jgi:hypothetical protein
LASGSSFRNKGIALGFVPIIIIGLVFGVYVGLFVPTSTRTTVNYSGFVATAENTSSTIALELKLSVNSTVIQSGEVLNISVSILNTLPKVNNVTGASDWALPVLQNFSTQPTPCPSYVSFQISNGYYTESNVSFATSPLQLSPPGLAIPCILLQRSFYLFQPSSNMAEFLVSTPPPTYFMVPMGISQLVRGSFQTRCCTNLSTITMIPVPPSSVPPFPYGVYTLVAGDEWGQLVLLHFAVE